MFLAASISLTGSAGTATDTYVYDAFDLPLTTTGTTPNSFLYSGEQFDSVLGMYYLRARYYNLPWQAERSFGHVHYLIMLLSADWFLPFWSEIGLDIDTATTAKMQEACREIVRTVIVKKSADAEGEFDYIDWRQECKSRAKSAFLELIERLDVRGVASVAVEAWTHRDHDGLKSAMMLSMITHELVEGVGGESTPPPDFATRVAVVEATVTYDLDPREFEEISKIATSTWDHYVQSLLDEMPTALSVNLQPAVQVYRLRMLWSRLSERPTVEQRQELLSWYRAIAKSRGFPDDPVPCFVGGHFEDRL